MAFDRITFVDNNYFPLKIASALFSCNNRIMLTLKMLADHLRRFPKVSFQYIEPTLTCFTFTNADRTYFSQVLIFNRKLEQAISILEDVVEQEGDYSISMVIWPKELYESGFIDDDLRNELIKSSDDHIVFPTNLYARYLLTIAYSSLGQKENHSNNLAELIVLLDRYSQFEEFSPMLDIISNAVVS